MSVAEPQFDINAQLPRTLPSDGDHGRAEIDAREPHVARVEGKVEPGADREL
jgi:hypothetical protein